MSNKLVIIDNLEYAKLALKHGDADLQQAMRKAANAIVGQINRKLQNAGLDEKLDTPFPEIVKR